MDFIWIHFKNVKNVRSMMVIVQDVNRDWEQMSNVKNVLGINYFMEINLMVRLEVSVQKCSQNAFNMASIQLFFKITQNAHIIALKDFMLMKKLMNASHVTKTNARHVKKIA
jgi:hypothetical protein